MALGAASCNDWLTLYPQDRVVEEAFWEDKNDLDGVRYATYKQMSGTLFNLIVWGDLRADSYRITSVDGVPSDQKGNRTNFIKVLAALADSTMSFYDWGSVYTTINYCNKVLEHGEQVLARDAQFTTTEWREIKAEMIAMRALNYFYLIRAFKDIPYSTKVINSDEEVMSFGLTNGMAVLDTLITDVRGVAGQGRNRFTSTADTKGMITNSAIYSLLAEMYLWRCALRHGRDVANLDWRSDCDSVIFYGQLALDALANQNELATAGGSMSNDNSIKDYFKDKNVKLDNATLISNERVPEYYTSFQDPTVPSFSAIFTTGNSRESIFELQYSASDNRKNTTVNTFWGNGKDGLENTSHLMISSDAIKKAYNKDESHMALDTRTWYGAQTLIEGQNGEGSPNLFKWYSCSFYNNSSKKIRTTATASEYRNWIIYRQTDVMLMIAEALAIRADAKTNSTGNADLKLCRAIVDAIHIRSMADQAKEAYHNSTMTTANCIKEVMNERQLELLGEGKRWFDLVRYAEFIGGGANPDPREPEYGDGQDGVYAMIDEYLATTYPSMKATLKNRLKNRYGLYSPIYYMEIKANDYLIPQNPVWNREK